MREKLAQINGRKSVFSGTFDHYGWRKFRGEFVGKTILLKDVKDKDGNVLTDHLWLKVGKRISKLGELKTGDVIRFTARVASYSKHRGEDFDFGLQYADEIAKVSGETMREEGQLSLTKFA